MLNSGVSDIEVFKKTGWFKGHNNQLFREVDDLSLQKDKIDFTIQKLLTNNKFSNTLDFLTINRRNTKFKGISIKYEIKESKDNRFYTEGNAVGNLGNADIEVSIFIPVSYTNEQKEAAPLRPSHH